MTTNTFNPLLTPYDLPPFDEIETKHYKPAIVKAIQQAENDIKKIKNNTDEPSFENTIVALEQSSILFNKVSTLFFNINSANTSDKIQSLAQEIAPLVTKFTNDVLFDETLFSKIKSVKMKVDMEKDKYSTEDKILLEKTYKDFARNGGELNGKDKAKLREYSMKLSTLTLSFGENLLKENNAYQLVIENEKDLKGIPHSIKDYYKQNAVSKDNPNAWVVTLDYPSYVPFITYADNGQLRKRLYEAFTTRCCSDNGYDNTGIIKQIVGIRQKMSQLLGYDNYANFVLEERMAKCTDNVNKFIKDMYDSVLPLAKKEKKDLEKFAKTITLDPLENWDLAYYSEKLKKLKHGYDEQMLKPYFPLQQTLVGMFEVARRLYDIRFKEVNNIPKYHEEVQTFEVYDEHEEIIAYFYADFFPRKSKRQGAWMTSYQSGAKKTKRQKPQISIVCNFSRSHTNEEGERMPSCLTFDEVKTLFHEFGHALHGILADSVYASLSGTSVLWDFVELPSQIMENWCINKEGLNLFAKHYKSKMLLAESEIKKIIEAEKFQQGMATLRQLSFAHLDINWHSMTKIDNKFNIFSFEKKNLEPFLLFKKSTKSCVSTAFAHIFQGGYAAGYYSYKWAEVLEADAFEYFEEYGVFNGTIAKKFKKLLSAGGSDYPDNLYREFRGRDPHIGALLKRIGV